MVPVTKEEKQAIEKRFQNAHFVRTMINDSKRHHYYCTEEPGMMKFLNSYRRRNVIEEHPARKPKGDGRR